MGHAKELSGPDLAAGVEFATLAEATPLLGHAQGEAVMLVRRGSTVHAIGATCTHYSGPLAEGLVVGDTVRCPWHHACFDLRSGEALGAPALEPVPCYQVVRHGTRVAVGGKQSHTPAPPPQSPASVVIVGAGAAGAAAAEKLRRLGYTGTITLIANEAPGPVDRPNLSKDFLAGAAPMEWVTLRDDGFYQRMQIELVRDEAVEIDTKGKYVTLKGGRRISYGKLLIAPGSEASRLPIEGASLPHVKTLRTLADAQAIIDAVKVDASAQARRVVVIGSSFIGLEVAASLRARNLEVDVVSRDRVPLAQVMGEQVGRFVQKLHEDKGVRFHLAAELRAIHERDVELASGRLPADLGGDGRGRETAHGSRAARRARRRQRHRGRRAVAHQCAGRLGGGRRREIPRGATRRPYPRGTLAGGRTAGTSRRARHARSRWPVQ